FGDRQDHLAAVRQRRTGTLRAHERVADRLTGLEMRCRGPIVELADRFGPRGGRRMGGRGMGRRRLVGLCHRRKRERQEQERSEQGAREHGGRDTAPGETEQARLAHAPVVLLPEGRVIHSGTLRRNRGGPCPAGVTWAAPTIDWSPGPARPSTALPTGRSANRPCCKSRSYSTSAPATARLSANRVGT